jgi:dihydroorotate dehydrogenase
VGVRCAKIVGLASVAVRKGGSEMIELSKKVKLSNVVVSTALGFGDGIPYYRWRSSEYRDLLAVVKDTETTIITKSITLNRKWSIPKVKRMASSMYNRYGLKNPGVVRVSEIMKEQRRRGFKIIPSIIGNTSTEYLKCIDYLEPDIVELNLSCPNMWYKFGKTEVIQKISEQYPNVLLIGKVGVYDHLDVIKKWVDAGLDVLHGINSVPVVEYYSRLRVKSVLNSENSRTASLPEAARKYKEGAFSGYMIYSIAYDFNLALRKEFPGLPIIMGGGVTEYADVNSFFDIEASSVSLCTAGVLFSLETSQMLKYYNNPTWSWGRYADQTYKYGRDYADTI